jgi:hypothetical protein
VDLGRPDWSPYGFIHMAKREILLGRHMEAAKPGCFTNDVTVHRLQQILARGVGGEIQLGVERIEFENVMMDRAWAGSRSKVGGSSAPRRDARTVASSVWKIARSQAFGQALCGTGYIESRPVERVGAGFVGGVFHVVKDHGIGLQAVRRWDRIRAQIPVKFIGRAWLVAGDWWLVPEESGRIRGIFVFGDAFFWA